MDMVLNGPENGKHTGTILIDPQKAFDTFDHRILLDKMMSIGFSGKAIKWFHSYLTNRAFPVSLDNEYTEAGIISCRVPQGSILGPLLDPWQTRQGSYKSGPIHTSVCTSAMGISRECFIQFFRNLA